MYDTFSNFDVSITKESGVFMAVRLKRNFLINRDFQFKFIIYTLVPSVFCLVIFYNSLSVYFSKLRNQGIEMQLTSDHPYFSLLQDQQELMNSLFISSAIFSMIFFVIWGILISHKIAGPLYRLTNFFKNANGDKFEKKLSFRPGDFFLEIPDAINEWIDKSQK